MTSSVADKHGRKSKFFVNTKTIRVKTIVKLGYKPLGYKPTENPYPKILRYYHFLLYLNAHTYEQKCEIVYVSEFSSMTLKNIFISLKCFRQKANFVAISLKYALS